MDKEFVMVYVEKLEEELSELYEKTNKLEFENKNLAKENKKWMENFQKLNLLICDSCNFYDNTSKCSECLCKFCKDCLPFRSLNCITCLKVYCHECVIDKEHNDYCKKCDKWICEKCKNNESVCPCDGK